MNLIRIIPAQYYLRRENKFISAFSLDFEHGFPAGGCALFLLGAKKLLRIIEAATDTEVTFWDNGREPLQEENSDIKEKLKIVDFTEEIPNVEWL